MPQTVSFPPAYFLRAPGEYHDVFGTVSAAPVSTNNVVVSFTLSENQVGVLLGVAMEAGQLTNWFWATWNLQIGDTFHQDLNGVQGMISRIDEPLSVWKVLKPGQRVRLLVNNANLSNAFTYGGRLFLYSQEKSVPLSDALDLPRGMEVRT